MTSTDRAIALGIASGGAKRYHSPLEPEPSGVTWSQLAHGVEMVSEQEAVVRDGDGRRARIRVEAPERGAVRMHMTVEDDVNDVALARMRLTADDGAYHGLGERFSRSRA